MIPHAILKSGLDHVIKAVSSARVLPVLSHIRITADQNGLSMQATDLQTSITSFSPGEFELLDICVPAGRFKTAVDMLTGNIEFKVGKLLSLKGDRGMAKIPYLDGSQMPSLAADPDVIATLPMDDIAPAISAVKFAAAVKDVRYYMIAIHLQSTGEMVTVSTTNGHVCATCTIPIKCPPFEALIPPSAYARVGESKTIDVMKSTVRFCGNGFTATLKLIDGKFPDFSRVFPQTDQVMTCDRQQMIKAAIATGNLYETALNKWVRIKNSDKLVMGVDEKGEGGSFDVDGEGDPIDCCYVIPYLVGALSNLKQDKATIMWSTTNALPQILIEEGNYRALIGATRV